MLESDSTAVSKEVNALVKDARALFQAASELSGEKARQVRHCGMLLLDTALAKAEDAPAAGVDSTRTLQSAKAYARENPWRMIEPKRPEWDFWRE